MIFVDTSFWVAIVNPRDTFHEAARDLIRATDSARLTTSNILVGETWTRLNSRCGHRTAVAALDSITASPRLQIASVDEGLEADAFSWLRKRDERAYSFADATSFALMKRERISRALTFDSDFEAAGFEIVRP